jgi:hypothetical protein
MDAFYGFEVTYYDILSFIPFSSSSGAHPLKDPDPLRLKSKYAHDMVCPTNGP